MMTASQWASKLTGKLFDTQNQNVLLKSLRAMIKSLVHLKESLIFRIMLIVSMGSDDLANCCTELS